MPLTTGTRLGPYVIEAPLGAGGMGEVYRARDTRLNRDVALKVLPDLFASDPDRLARFTREAQTLAALNHTNIAHIHGLEELPGPAEAGRRDVSRALAMELVDGEDLSAIIARGPMPLAEALPIARQIADALEAAHEQGIVHRDLKPANIKIRPDGTVKVLDFGLAKALAPEGAGATADAMHSPTLTMRATQMGVVLGTAAYMSPEQARGKPVDRRADIWAFGVVLYEMLAGRRAFEGDDISITLANVLKEEPKWADLPADLPPPVARLLRRCLEKEPKRRLSAIGDARLELDEPVPAAPVARPSTPASRLSWVLPALAGAALTAVVAFALWPRSTATPAAATRLAILAPPGEELYPDSSAVVISPDGTMVAFTTGAVSRSESQLWVRSMESMTARRLEAGDGASSPFWSPDSRRIGFFTNTKLKVVSASGGRAETLADAPGGRGGTWNPADVIVFAPDFSGPLMRMPATGGTPEPVTALDAARKELGHRFPSFLPDGAHFLYSALPGRNGKYDIFVGSLNDQSRTAIGSMEATPVFADPGWLLLARQGVLAAVPFDARALKVTGNPVTLEDEPTSILDSAWALTAGTSVSVAPAGSLAYFSAGSTNMTATWRDANGVALGTLALPAGHYESVAISPDGTRGVLVKSLSPSESTLWIADLARGGATPFSTGKGRNDYPVWSPDGFRIVWSSDREGVQNLYVKNVDDAAPEKPLYTSDVLFKFANGWSPDGRWIVMTQLDEGTAQNVWRVDPAGAKPATPVVRGPVRDNGGVVSPDGRWLLYSSEDGGRFEVYAQSFPEPGRKIRISERGGLKAWWSRDGRQIIFLGNDVRTLWRVDVQPGETLGVGTPKPFVTLPADVAWVDAMPDRQRFLTISPERTSTGSITVVQNWRAALTEKR